MYGLVGEQVEIVGDGAHLRKQVFVAQLIRLPLSSFSASWLPLHCDMLLISSSHPTDK